MKNKDEIRSHIDALKLLLHREDFPPVQEPILQEAFDGLSEGEFRIVGYLFLRAGAQREARASQTPRPASTDDDNALEKKPLQAKAAGWIRSPQHEIQSTDPGVMEHSPSPETRSSENHAEQSPEAAPKPTFSLQNEDAAEETGAHGDEQELSRSPQELPVRGAESLAMTEAVAAVDNPSPEPQAQKAVEPPPAQAITLQKAPSVEKPATPHQAGIDLSSKPALSARLSSSPVIKGVSDVSGVIKTSNIPYAGPTSFKPSGRSGTQGVTLKNARQDEPYSYRIEGLKDVRFHTDGGSGLGVDSDGLVKGTPLTAGDFILRFGALKNGSPVQIEARVSVIANPRKLWVSLTSDRKDPFWKPDSDFQIARGDGLVIAASLRGRSHAKDGGFRDDHCAISATGPGGWHLLVVADGAGSATHAREGSRIAVEATLERLPDLLARIVDPAVDADLRSPETGWDGRLSRLRSEAFHPALVEAASCGVEAIEAAARSLGLAPAHFYTTLLIAVARKTPKGWIIGSFSIGDGAIALYDAPASRVRVLCRPDGGEFAGQTRFLTREEFESETELKERVFIEVAPEFTALAVMTDGITDPLFPTDDSLSNPDVWREFWEENITRSVSFYSDASIVQKEFLEWIDFWSRGNHDDRTLALLLTGEAE